MLGDERMSESTTSSGPLIRNISDTALWVAIYRARESERADAHFRDPFARRLAGARGEEIARSMKFGEKHSWSFVARTVIADSYIQAEVAGGVDMVVNLAAGLDARPYRMGLPVSLRWVEVDLPGILEYKEEILRDEQPKCALERVRLDLSDAAQRHKLFARLGAEAKRALVVSEGLIVYLTPDEVGALARDLAAIPSFEKWIIDMASPGLLRMMQKEMGDRLPAGTELKFAPEQGPEFFLPHGWRPREVRTLLKTASRLRRLPFPLNIFGLLPESPRPRGQQPWSAVCLMGRAQKSPA